MSLNGNITGGTATVQVGGGTLSLGGTNTYTGETIIGNGTLDVKSVSDYGVASAIGSRAFTDENGTPTGVGLHIQGGTLKFSGATAQSTNRNIRILNGPNGAAIDASGTVPSATVSFTLTGANFNLFDTGGTRTLTLKGTNTGDNGFSIQLTNQATNATSLTKTGAGTWVLNGPDANTATGATTVVNGTLKLAKIGVSAVSGGLSIGDGSASATVQLGGTGGNQIVDTIVPTFVGGGATNSILRLNNLSETIGGLNSAGGAGIVENESGSVGTGTLTVNVATTQTFSGTLRDGNGVGTDGTLAFTKTGAGTQTLSGVNTHSGATTVSGGTLTVDGSLPITSAVSVTGATLNGQGTVAGTVTVGLGGLVAGSVPFNVSGTTNVLSGGTIGGLGAFTGAVNLGSGGHLSPASATTPGTITINGLTLASGSIVDLEFGASNDLVNVSAVNGLTINGGAFNLFGTGGITPLTTNGTYTILDYNTSFSGSMANITVANAQTGKFYTIANDTLNSLIALTIGDAVTSEWTNGSTSNTWTPAGNWNNGITPNTAGSVAKFAGLATPGSVAVNGPKTVGGITFDNAASYTLSGTSGDTLTLNNGIAAAVVTVISGSHEIAAPVILATNANTAVADGSILTLSGNISGSGSLSAANANTGITVLTGANNYGATNVSNGTLQVGNGGTTGTLGSGDANVSASGTLSFMRSDDIAVANNIGGLSGTVAQSGTGTLTLTGVNTFGTTAGGLKVNSGTVKVGNATALPAGMLATVNGTLDLNTQNVTLGALAGTGGTITDHGVGIATTTLTVNQATNTTFDGGILNGTDRTIALSKVGNGTLTLTGSTANNFSGGTSVTGGSLTLAKSGGNAIPDNVQIGDGVGSDFLQLGASDQIADTSVLTFTAGGGGNSAFFHLNGFNETVHGIQTTVGNAAVIANNGGGTSTLTVDTGTDSFTYDGIIRNGSAGTIGLIKEGTGTLTLKNTAGAAATDYTGDTIINSGRLILSNLPSFAGPITINSTATDALIIDQATRDSTMTGIISGTGALVKNGPFSVRINGANVSFSGAITLNDGMLNIGNNNALGTGPITINGGNIRAAGAARLITNTTTANGSFTIGRVTDFSSPVTITSNLTITANNPDGPANGNSIFNGGVTGPFVVTFAEGPQLIGTGAIMINGVNSNNGTIVASGRVNVGFGGALANAPLTVNGGNLILNNFSQDVTSFSGTGGTVNIGAGSKLRTTQSVATAYFGVLTDLGGVTLDGPGELTLSGASNYTGDTNVNDGDLIVTGTITGTTLNVNSATAKATIEASQTLAGLNIGDGAVVTLASPLPPAPSAALAPEISGMDGAAFGTSNVAPVPEPGSVSLLLFGGLSLLTRRSRAKAAR